MIDSIWEIGSRTRWMDSATLRTPMGLTTKVTSKKIWLTATASLVSMTRYKDTQAGGLTTYVKALAPKLSRLKITLANIQESGKPLRKTGSVT